MFKPKYILPVFILFIPFAAMFCTDELKEYQVDPSLKAGKLTLKGEFCADKVQSMNFPVHILFVVDKSFEVRQRDADFCRSDGSNPPCPLGDQTNMRQEAMREVWQRYIVNPYYDFGIITYSSIIHPVSLQSDQNIFVGGYSFGPYVGSILEPQDDPTLIRDMYHGLEYAKFYINHHLSQTPREDRLKQKYIVMLFTTGIPESTSGIVSMAGEIRGLKNLWGAGEIVVNTAFLVRDTVPAGEITQTTTLMNNVASMGNGESLRFFPDNDPLDVVSFMTFDLNPWVQNLTVKSLVASNLSVKVNQRGSLVVDSDGDGLPDAEDNRVVSNAQSFFRDSDGGGCTDFVEIALGLNPDDPSDDCDMTAIPGHDTDGDTCPDILEFAVFTNITDPSDCHISMFTDGDSDGCSDYVEMILSLNSQTPLDPLNSLDCSPSILYDSDLDGCGDFVEVLLNLDPLNPFDCPCPDYKRVDTDSDGLNDCEEELMGLNKYLFDTDRDGLSDLIEFHGGSNPNSSEDGFLDLDNDGISNNQEVREHTNPRGSDSSERTQIAYQYELTNKGLNSEGINCYEFAVRNISLLNTQKDAFGREGVNRIILNLIQTPQNAVFANNQGIMRRKEMLVRFVSRDEMYLIGEGGQETRLDNCEIVFEDEDIKGFDILD